MYRTSPAQLGPAKETGQDDHKRLDDQWLALNSSFIHITSRCFTLVKLCRLERPNSCNPVDQVAQVMGCTSFSLNQSPIVHPSGTWLDHETVPKVQMTPQVGRLRGRPQADFEPAWF